MKKYNLFVLLVIALTLSTYMSGYSQEDSYLDVITVLDEDFENPRISYYREDGLDKYIIYPPEGWTPGFDPKGIGANWAIVQSGVSIPGNNTLTFATIEGSHLLYCAGEGYIDGYSTPDYPDNMETMIYTPSINPSERDYRNAQNWTLSWRYLIPSIGNNDLFKVKIKYSDGQELTIFETKDPEDFIGSANEDITDRIDSRPFQIGFFFYSNSRSDGEEGVYIDEVSLLCTPAEGIDLSIPERGAQWIKGETYTLNWASNFSSTEQLDLVLYSGGLFHNTQFYIPNTGSYDFTLPEDLPSGDGYYFEISKVSDPDVSCYSYRFRIMDKPRSLLNAQSTYVEFAKAYVDHEATKKIMIENLGGAQTGVDITYTGDPAFSVDPEELTLTPGGEMEVLIRYKPTALGSDEGIMRIKGADNELVMNIKGNSSEVPVSFLTIEPESERFGEVELGDAKILSFIIRNKGNTTQDVDVSINGGASFSLVNPDDDKSFALATSGEHSWRKVDIRFEPSTKGKHTGYMAAFGYNTTADFNLSGTGIEKLDDPDLSHAPGAYEEPISVSIDYDPRADLRYTTSGLVPDMSAPRYSGPIQISSSTTLKARAMAGHAFVKGSDVVSANYAIEPVLSPVTASLQPGEYFDQISVSLFSSDDGVEIYYTVDGSKPTQSSGRYSGTPISITQTTNLKARSFKEGHSPSPVFSGIYEMKDPASADAWTAISLPSKVYDFNFDMEGNLWACGDYIYKYAEGEWINMGGGNYQTTKIRKDRNGDLIFFDDYGFLLKDGALSELYDRYTHPFAYGTEDVYIEEDGTIWFATTSDGIIRYSGEEYIQYSNESVLESSCYVYEYLGDEEKSQYCAEQGLDAYNFRFLAIHELPNGNILFIGEEIIFMEALIAYEYDGSEFHLRTEMLPTPEQYAVSYYPSSYLGQDQSGGVWFRKEIYDKTNDAWDAECLRYDGQSFMEVPYSEDSAWLYSDYRHLYFADYGDIVMREYNWFRRFSSNKESDYRRIKHDLPGLGLIRIDNNDDLWIQTADQIFRYNRPVHDLSIRVLGYYSGCDLAPDTDMSIHVANLGTEQLSNLIVGANVNGINVFSDRVEQTLESEEEARIELPYQLDLSKEDKNTIEFYGMIEGDQYRDNNRDFQEVFNTYVKNIPWDTYDLYDNHEASCYSIHEDGSGNIWAWGSEKVLLYKDNKWELSFDVTARDPGSERIQLYFSKDGSAWALSAHKLFQYMSGEWEFLSDIPPYHEYHRIYDDDQIHPLSSEQFIIRILSPEANYEYYKYEDHSFELFPDEYFYHIELDSKGTLWRSANGILQSRNPDDTWNDFRIDPDDHISIMNFWIDKTDRIWIPLEEDLGICTFKDGVFQYNNTVTNNSRIGAFIEAGEDEFWLSLEESNDMIHIKGGKWTFINDYNTDLPSKLRYPFLLDPNGNTWFTSDGGPVRYNGSTWDIFNECTGLPRGAWHIIEGNLVVTENQVLVLYGNDIFSMTSNDLGINRILSPEVQTGMFFNKAIKVELTNNGILPQSGFSLQCFLNGEAVASDQYTDVLHSGETYVHEFSERIDISTPGAHELIVYISNAEDGYSGNDTVERTFEVMEVSSIEGNVYTSEGAMTDSNSEWVAFIKNQDRLRKYSNGNVNPDGSFYVENLVPDTAYYFRVNVGDHQQNTNLLNTYYDSTFFWEDADIIKVQKSETKAFDFPMVEIPEAETGIGIISGKIYYPVFASEKSTVVGIKKMNGTDNTGDVVSGVDVYLMDETGGIPLKHDVAETWGYRFYSLPFGEYSIKVDIPGIPQLSTYRFALNSMDSAFSDLNFIVDTIAFSISQFTDIEILHAEEGFELLLFPNPGHDILNIRYQLGGDSRIKTSIIDNQGRILDIEEGFRESGEHLIQKEIGSYAPGYYILVFERAGWIYTKPFVKQ